MRVRLTPLEMDVAVLLGNRRHTESLNRATTRGQPRETSLDSHIVGAIGEVAAAKALGLYPGFTVNNFSGPDIQPNIQVRAAPKGRLIISEKDDPFDKYVLVLGYGPDLDVAGWIWGHEAKVPKWLWDPGNDRPPAYFVPREALLPIGTCRDG